MPALFFILSIALSFSTEVPAPGYKDYAIFFAVDNYEDSNLDPLKHPVSDAQAIADILEKEFGYYTEILKNPGLKEIESKLYTCQQNFQNGTWDPNGRLLIYFSGHGEVEAQNGFFIPRDGQLDRLWTSAFSYNSWRGFINALNCKHIMVMVDACYSGTFDPSWWNRSKSRKFGERPGELGDVERMIKIHETRKTRLFFTSATEVKTPDKSEFAKKILEGLMTNGGKDGILTSSELFTHLQYAVPTPHRGEFGDDEAGSSFLFISKDRKPGKPAMEEIEVNTIQSFISAIGPNRKIVVKGVDLLIELPGKGPENEYASLERVFDGFELRIHNVNNLQIVGDEEASLLSPFAYADVIQFVNSEDITIEKLSMGHKVPKGSCQGGVLNFKFCKNIKIKDCQLFGSGVDGIASYQSESLTVENSRIYECTYNGGYIFDTDKVTFKNCLFENNAFYDALLLAVNCNEVNIEDCEFKGNSVNDKQYSLNHLIQLYLSKEINVKDCRFTDNEMHGVFAPDVDSVQLQVNGLIEQANHMLTLDKSKMRSSIKDYYPEGFINLRFEDN